jgi:uncharacterized membrane protein
MARCDTTQKFTASPKRVWQQFQPERMKSWYGPEIQALTPGPLTKGSRISVNGRSGARSFGYEATVTDYAENRTLAWEGSDGKASYRVIFTMTPKDGGTLLLFRDEFRLRGLMGRLIERFFMVKRVAKYDRQFLGKLKRLVEQGSMKRGPA